MNEYMEEEYSRASLITALYVAMGVSLLLSTHSVDPCFGGESDHPAFGPPACLSLHHSSGVCPQIQG